MRARLRSHFDRITSTGWKLATPVPFIKSDAASIEQFPRNEKEVNDFWRAGRAAGHAPRGTNVVPAQGRGAAISSVL